MEHSTPIGIDLRTFESQVCEFFSRSMIFLLFLDVIVFVVVKSREPRIGLYSSYVRIEPLKA